MSEFETAQATINAMFENKQAPDENASDRILRYARRGARAPESLSHREMQQVCYALLEHYAQMGIG